MQQSLPALLLAVLVTALVSPAGAQTPSVWHNQKLSDMRNHERSKIVGTEAGNHYDLALGYIERMQSRLDVEDRSARQEKKLRKLYRKAVDHLEKAVEAAPEWLDSRMMLGMVHLKMEAFEAAKDAYEGALALDPENEDAQAYLSTVNWHLDRRAGSGPKTEGSGGR